MLFFLWVFCTNQEIGCKIMPEMAYNVSTRTLNATQLNSSFGLVLSLLDINIFNQFRLLHVDLFPLWQSSMQLAVWVPVILFVLCWVALEKMDSMLSSPTRWNAQYQEVADVDEYKLSECGEAFMILISTLTG